MGFRANAERVFMRGWLRDYLKRHNGLKRMLFRCYSYCKGTRVSDSGNGNVVENRGARMLNVNISISGNDNSIIIGEDAHLSGVDFLLHGDGHKCIVGERCSISGGSFWFEDIGGVISIGSDTTSEGADFATIEGAQITVGRDCMFSFGIDVRVGDSHSIIDCQTNMRINPSEDIVIGDHVWIGANATILKGVTIAKDNIVGNRALVTKSCMEGNCVIVGVPAKIVKRNVTWDRVRV